MPSLVKPNGPQGVAHPFIPTINESDPAERIAHALEHIAVVLSAIDHNVEGILKAVKGRQF